MAWLILVIAGCFEVAGVSTLNVFANSENKTKKVLFLIATICLFACSLGSLSIAMQTIPMSMAYAVWTGIGTIGAVIVGVVFNHDKLSLQKILGLLMIISSAIALKIV